MRWLRAGGAVLLGYVISQGVNGVLVYFWYVRGSAPGLGLRVGVTAAVFAATGWAAGAMTSWAGGVYGGRASLAAGGLVGLVTVANIVIDVAAEPLWHKLVVLFLMAPLIALAGTRTKTAPESGRDGGGSSGGPS